MASAPEGIDAVLDRATKSTEGLSVAPEDTSSQGLDYAAALQALNQLEDEEVNKVPQVRPINGAADFLFMRADAENRIFVDALDYTIKFLTALNTSSREKFLYRDDHIDEEQPICQRILVLNNESTQIWPHEAVSKRRESVVQSQEQESFFVTKTSKTFKTFFEFKYKDTLHKWRKSSLGFWECVQEGKTAALASFQLAKKTSEQSWFKAVESATQADNGEFLNVLIATVVSIDVMLNPPKPGGVSAMYARSSPLCLQAKPKIERLESARTSRRVSSTPSRVLMNRI